MTAPRYSVIVPVVNEAENIGVLCRRCRAKLPPNGEVLICYDFPADNTLPALRALADADKPLQLRLIHNTLGRGVRHAIEAGMRAATAPIIVVMMADLSDDFPIVAEMIGRAEAGADGGVRQPLHARWASNWRAAPKGLLEPPGGCQSSLAGGSAYPRCDQQFQGLSPRVPGPYADQEHSRLQPWHRTHRQGSFPRRPRGGSAGGMDGSLAGQSRFRLCKWLPNTYTGYVWALGRRLASVRASGNYNLYKTRTVQL